MAARIHRKQSDELAAWIYQQHRAYMPPEIVCAYLNEPAFSAHRDHRQSSARGQLANDQTQRGSGVAPDYHTLDLHPAPKTLTSRHGRSDIGRRDLIDVQPTANAFGQHDHPLETPLAG